MNYRKVSVMVAVLFIAISASISVFAQALSPQQQLARDIFRELVEINTVTASGDTAKAAEAMVIWWPDRDSDVH